MLMILMLESLQKLFKLKKIYIDLTFYLKDNSYFCICYVKK